MPECRDIDTFFASEAARWCMNGLGTWVCGFCRALVRLTPHDQTHDYPKKFRCVKCQHDEEQLTKYAWGYK
jgi:hypothetical protein